MTRAIGAALAALLGAALLIAPVTATASATTPAPAPTTTTAQQLSADGVAPIAVLLDTSGSMNEDDGTGTLKLRGAKNAVRDIVQNLSPTTVFALRTYPAGGGCDGGKYVRSPAPLTNVFGDNSADSVLGSVEGITADGSTPTGEALRALADDLTARGYTAATIVLVSDGESTCSTPPCDVAKQLVQEGFDVTVPTIGFRTSARGSEELACVAEATGGVYLDAGDSAELAEQLDSLVRSQLELSVRYDSEPMPGSSTKITAVIRHRGGEDAKDVRVALTLADAATPELRRAAIPPMVRIGNIPAGSTVERSWTVGTGPRSGPKKTLFTVSAWGTNAVRVAFKGEYTPSTPTYSQEALGGLFTGVSKEHPLVVFGDSYSSGEGTNMYEKSIEGVSLDCHRSYQTYLGTIFSKEEMKIVACSGAVTDGLTWSSAETTISQIHEMNSFGYVPGAGVMTLGGNDIGFEPVVRQCVTPTGGGCGGEDFRAAKVKDAENVQPKLEAAYRAAWSAMNTPDLRAKRDGAYAPLIVLAYPQLTHESARGACGTWFGPGEVLTSEALVTALNDAVEAAVLRVQRDGYSVMFVGDVEGAFRPDNTICEEGDAAYANGLVFGASQLEVALPESFHPNVNGYIAETDAILRWSRTADVWTEPGPYITDETILGNAGPRRDPVELIWPTTFDTQKQTDALKVPQGGALAPTGSGYAPGTPVTGTLFSDPVVLGTLIADENGDIDGVLRIPQDVPPGQHTLVISALSTDGENIESQVPVSVVFPTPWWVWGALVLGIVLLLGGVALALVGLLIQRRAAIPEELS